MFYSTAAAQASSGRCLELLVEHVRIVGLIARLVLGPGRHIRGELGTRAWWRGDQWAENQMSWQQAPTARY